ncbi:MAG: hypothetical protein CMJ65_11585 [Planctomycetaceae bacterium]|jgi:uncharacterized protein YjiK|nr:hypothetical protein [Planctomycetaceae bacterium]
MLRLPACRTGVLFPAILLAGLAGQASWSQPAVAAPPTGGGLAGPSRKNDERLDVSQYTARTQAHVIQGVSGNASGVTFNRDSGTLFVAINGPPLLVEIDTAGKTRRIIHLEGFDDTEGVVYLGKNRFGILEERRRHLCVVRIGKKDRSVKFTRLKQVDQTGGRQDKDWYFLVDPKPTRNTGLEGLTYDRKHRRFFIVKEKYPVKVLQVALAKKRNAPPVVSQPWDAANGSLQLSDLSGVHYHAATRQLLILSHESRSVVQCALDGRVQHRLSLATGSAGLSRDVPQAEGITLDEQQTLYIISEPNLLYVFEKKE